MGNRSGRFASPCYFVGTRRQILSNWWHTVRTARTVAWDRIGQSLATREE